MNRITGESHSDKSSTLPLSYTRSDCSYSSPKIDDCKMAGTLKNLCKGIDSTEIL